MYSREEFLDDYIEEMSRFNNVGAILDTIDDYISFKIDDKQFKKELENQKLDPYIFAHIITHDMEKRFKSLRKDDSELWARFIKMMYIVGNYKMFQVWRLNTILGSTEEERIEIIKELNIPIESYILSLSSDASGITVRNWPEREKKYTDRLIHFSRKYKNEFLRAVDWDGKSKIRYMLLMVGVKEGILDEITYESELAEYIFDDIKNGFYNNTNVTDLEPFITGDKPFNYIEIKKIASRMSNSLGSLDYTVKRQVHMLYPFINCIKIVKKTLDICFELYPSAAVEAVVEKMYKKKDNYRIMRMGRSNPRKVAEELKSKDINRRAVVEWLATDMMHGEMESEKIKLAETSIVEILKEEPNIVEELKNLESIRMQAFVEKYIREVEGSSLEDESFEKVAKEHIEKLMTRAFDLIQEADDLGQLFKKFLNDEIEESSIKPTKKLRLLDYMYGVHIGREFRTIRSFKNTRAYNKLIKFILKLENGRLLESLISNNFKESLEIKEVTNRIYDLCDDYVKLVHTITMAYELGHRVNYYKPLIKKLSIEKFDEFIKGVKLCTASEKEILMEMFVEFGLFKTHEEKIEELTSNLAPELSNEIKELIINTVACKEDSEMSGDEKNSLNNTKFANVDWEKIKEIALNKDVVKLCSSNDKEILMEMFGELKLFKTHKKEMRDLMKTLAADTSKAVKKAAYETICEELGEEEAKNIGIELLEEKKAGAREAGVLILQRHLDEEIKNMIKEKIETESSSKVKNLMMETIGSEEDTSMAIGDMSVDRYCKENLNKRKLAKLKWLEVEKLPKLIFADEKEAALETSQYILLSFAENTEVKLNKEVKEMMNRFSKKSLSIFAEKVFERWSELGAAAKQKWVLSLVGMFADGDLAVELEKNIREWPKHSRTAMACEGLKALAINGTDRALIAVDSIARKFKFKKVKQAAMEALEFAASELGIDKEEISDRIVSNLGFDERGEKEFSYGTRTFIARLTQDLKLEIVKEDGKTLKNLPKPNKDDDEEKAAAAKEELKNLKKQLKNLVKVQAERLEYALSVNRKWESEKWNNLFVNNAIMHQFACGLVWGVYEGEELKETFRYMDDGSFTTSDEDEFELKKEFKVGLVHPIELSKEELETWQEQIEDYEIEQPFEQLHRQCFFAKEGVDYVDDFEGYEVNGATLHSRLTNRSWYRGSVRDAGWYQEYYKEEGIIGAEIEFEGMGTYDMQYETPVVYGLRFYQAGTVSRGSYVYDKIEEKNKILPQDVSKRFYSEIVYDLMVATRGAEKKENYKKDMHSNYKTNKK